MQKQYFNYKEAMSFLGIGSYHTLEKLIKEGLRVSIIGGVKRINIEDIREFMKAKTI